jgi:hypothetical protein
MEPQAPPRMAGAAGDIHQATDEIQQHVDSVIKIKIASLYTDVS